MSRDDIEVALMRIEIVTIWEWAVKTNIFVCVRMISQTVGQNCRLFVVWRRTRQQILIANRAVTFG
jgi:hypothetical protein